MVLVRKKDVSDYKQDRIGWNAGQDSECSHSCLTFAHEQHAGPEQRLFGHRCYVDTFGTGMFQAGAAMTSLVSLLCCCCLLGGAGAGMNMWCSGGLASVEHLQV
jgi:hypothetical protein